MSSFQAIEVFLNGRPLLMAGAPDALLISLHVSVLINSTDAATLHVSGMRDLGKARQSHVQWLDELALAGGDELRMRLASVHRATPPTEDIATDSDEHLAAHASYEAEMVANPPKVSELHRKRPEGTLEVMVNGGAPIVAHFTGGRDLLMLGATWNRARPGRWRVSLTSCSTEEAIGKLGGKDWFIGHVDQQQWVTVRIGDSFVPGSK